MIEKPTKLKLWQSNISDARVYTTKGGFIGAVHTGSGYEFGVVLSYKEKWYSSYKTIKNGDSNFWVIGEPYYNYWIRHSSGSVYERKLVAIPDRRQGTHNWIIRYSADHFRSRGCSLGTYDYNVYGECYVGTVPEGTTPFVWGPNNNDLRFYYTPVNGNQCPMAGSSFDGNNCFVVNIPAGVEAYTWQRNMLVKSDLL